MNKYYPAGLSSEQFVTYFKSQPNFSSKIARTLRTIVETSGGWQATNPTSAAPPAPALLEPSRQTAVVEDVPVVPVVEEYDVPVVSDVQQYAAPVVSDVQQYAAPVVPVVDEFDVSMVPAVDEFDMPVVPAVDEFDMPVVPAVQQYDMPPKPSVSAAPIKQVSKCTTPPAVLKEAIPLSLRALNRDVKIPYSKKLCSMVEKILKEKQLGCTALDVAVVVLRGQIGALEEVGTFTGEMLNWKVWEAGLCAGDIVHVTMPLPLHWHLTEDDESQVMHSTCHCAQPIPLQVFYINSKDGRTTSEIPSD